MNYFKDKNNKVLAFDDHQVSQGHADKYTAITESEKNEILAPKGADLVAYNYDQAKLTRDNAVVADLDSNGLLWQVRSDSDLRNIQDVIDEHKYKNLDSDITQKFRMADNTVEYLTVDKFELALSDYRLRKQAAWDAFFYWLETDMITPFQM